MGSWVRRGLVGRLVALIIVVGVAASCGGGESNSGTDSGGDGAGTGNSDGDDQSDDDLSWVPFGPGDPAIPSYWGAYRRFADGNCSELRDYLSNEGSDLGEFGRAMAAVCTAAIEGDQGQWDVAEAALAAGAPFTIDNACLASVVEDLLRRAIEWHNRNPGKNPDVRFNRVADSTECKGQDESDEDTTDDENGEDTTEDDTDDDTTDDESETDDDTTDDETETDDDTTDDTDTEGSTEGDETSEAAGSLRGMSA